MSARKKNNHIWKLKNDACVWVDGDALAPIITDYFSNIFHSTGVQEVGFFDGFQSKVTPEQNEALLKPFEPGEVAVALFSMNPDNAPGPNGMNPAFFQHFWSDIGADVTEFVLNCLHTSTLPPALNDATIMFILKKSRPEFPTDLRPIALCNVLYKIIGKMLASRMKDILNCVISDTQSAFVPGRLIIDNILAAAEARHYLRRKQGGWVGWAGLKLDIAKAYDRFEWCVFRRMMETLGFHARWIELVMSCVTTVRYKVRVNGQLMEAITPTRGIRQGDPLSPYLFIICAEGLSLMLQREEKLGHISGLKIARQAPAISHLLFADDSLLFFKATSTEANVIREVLWKYEVSSGQAVNYNKSTITFSGNTYDKAWMEVAGILAVNESPEFGKYLGLPSVIGRNKKQVFRYIAEMINNRMGS